MKLDWNHIVQDSLAIVLGVGVLAVAGYAAMKVLPKLGLFAYNGLSPEQVDSVAAEVDGRLQILSRVAAPDNSWYRGVYLAPNGYPLYYRWDVGRSFELYPMLAQTWSTDGDLLGTSGNLIYP